MNLIKKVLQYQDKKHHREFHDVKIIIKYILLLLDYDIPICIISNPKMSMEVNFKILVLVL